MQHDGLIEEINGAYARLEETAEALASADRKHAEHVRRAKIDNADAIFEAKNERTERLYVAGLLDTDEHRRLEEAKNRAELDHGHARHEVERLRLVARLVAAPAPGLGGSWEGWLYLADVVLDAYSRKVVGWSMANHLRTELVLDALNMAIHNRRPAAGLVHHSDRGSQYTSVEFGGRLKEAGLVPSMGSVADAYDNALAESFVPTLKRELLHRHSWPSKEGVRAGIFEYIECFYNPRRRHSSLGQMSPVEYEKARMKGAAVA